MLQPGFKVFHIPDIDYRSGCVTFCRCLKEIDTWSRAHPGHLPIIDARTGSHARANAAAASGAQAVSTDDYPGAPSRPGIRFAVTLPGGVMERYNPLLRPGACTLR